MSVLSATAGKCALFMQQGETFALRLLGRIQLYTTMCMAVFSNKHVLTNLK